MHTLKVINRSSREFPIHLLKWIKSSGFYNVSADRRFIKSNKVNKKNHCQSQASGSKKLVYSLVVIFILPICLWVVPTAGQYSST